MDATVALFILGCAVVALIAVLLLRSQNRDGRAEASFTFGDLFSASVALEPRNTASAEQAVQEAAHLKGDSDAPAAGLATTAPTRLARVLWVDDNPDGNLYETVALERIGRFVTKATSNEAAMHYLGELDFDLVITDLGRASEAEGGADLIRRLQASGQSLPIVVYTVDAASRRAALVAQGATAVVDRPRDLVNVVDEQLRRRVGSVG
ncbi:response regulator [Actinoplanes sp. URMC 104]|uniref:response regulator n=1 Tax=Actinoplanes sp. URMC 104 TaxID=3423409 RepID=UPI003F1A21FF